MSVPAAHIRPVNLRPLNAAADFVLYWMTSARRASWNFALDRAIEHARALKKPLVVLEALRCDYPWASDRPHRFVLDDRSPRPSPFVPSRSGRCASTYAISRPPIR